jgi:hypothetical protein
MAQFVDDRVVVPGAGADEGLDRLAVQTGLGGDRLTGLAFQAAEEPADDRAGMGLVFDAVEPREVALQEGGQAVLTACDGLGGEGGVGQQGLSVGVIQETHGEPSGPIVHASG